MEDSPVPIEQRARLVELEARQQQLKRLCEEALKEDDEHQHIFQQLEERNMASSTVGSLYGAGSASGGGAATQQGRTAATTNDDFMDDLLTGEVRSLRDPNSITRASSTGSVVGARGGSGSYPRNASLDRPATTRLDSAYRPPTYPTTAADTTATAAPTAGVMPPPPPPRATLYSTTRQPRADPREPTRTSLSRIPSPSQPSTTTVIPPSWRRSDGGAEPVRPTLSSAQGGLKGTAAAMRPSRYSAPVPSSAPLLTSPAAAPPPPPPERSRSPSHSVPMADRYQRSGSYYHTHTMPPPPPPPSSTSYSGNYERSPRSRMGLPSPAAGVPLSRASPPPPPAPTTSSTLVSPDEVTDNLPPPPPRPRSLYTTPENRPSAAANYRSAPLSLSKGPPPPPPPSPPGASRKHGDGESSFVSATSTDHDLARWRRQLGRNETNVQRSGSAYPSPTYTPPRAAPAAAASERRLSDPNARKGSWAKMQSLVATSQRGIDRRPDAAAARGVDKGPHTQGSPPLPPPPPPPPPPSSSSWSKAVGMPPPSRQDDADYPSNRWETVSLTPSLRREEESRLHHFFATDEKVSPRTLADYTGTANRPSHSTWRSSAGGYGARQQRPSQRHASPLNDRTATVLHYDSSVTDESYASSTAGEDVPPPPPTPPLQPFVAKEFTPRGAAAAAAAVPMTRKKASHPYGDQTTAFSKPPVPPVAGSAASVTPLFTSLYPRQQRSSSARPDSGRNSVWENDTPPPPPQQHAPTDLSGEAGGAAAQPAFVAGGSEFFDMGPEKEALLTLLRKSTRAGAADTAAQRPLQPGVRSEESPSIARPDASAGVYANTPRENPFPAMERDADADKPLRDVHTAQSPTPQKFVFPPFPTDGSTRRAPSAKGKRPSPPLCAEDIASPQLQRQCEEAQAKAEALARHLVKAITDRKMLQGNVEELEELVEECNAEVGRLQKIVEEQHQDSSTSFGVQAALRAKEREVAVYEDEIRRLNGVLEDHLTRTSATKQYVQNGLSQTLVAKEAEAEAAMAEVGMAHVAQRDAEERASQLANELETAVEQIQFLDERLAEMERAAAAAQFEKVNAHLHRSSTGSDPLMTNDDRAPHPPAGTPLSVPSAAETQYWPVEARRALAQLVAQAQGILQQNAEGERHAAMRQQHIEHMCNELQQHLHQREAEVERAEEACQQLRQEKNALQACGEQWYQQLRDVKEDAQLVSEIMRTARGDAEDVYLASRLAQERVAEQQAAAAAASPFGPAAALTPSSSSAVDATTLRKCAQFAQQVMSDFHAMARFLSSLRKMDIGDRNGYLILQSIAKGRSPAEGLFITADDAATPNRMIEHLPADAASEAKRRVQKKKARVLQAVERALKLEKEPNGALKLHGGLDQSRTTSSSAGVQLPVAIPLGLPPRAEVERASTVMEVVTADITPEPAPVAPAVPAEVESAEEPDSFVDEVADELESEPEVEVVTAAMQPPRLGSYSYRGGSSGMVHSDLRRQPADVGLSASHNSSQATPLMSGGQPSAPRPTMVAGPSATAAVSQGNEPPPPSTLPVSQSSPIPRAVNGGPICSALYMGDDAEPPSPSTARPSSAQPTVASSATTATNNPTTTTAAPPTPPPPSVSRPLRLSTTPSQPQSAVKEARETSNAAQRSIVDVAAEDTVFPIAAAAATATGNTTPMPNSVRRIDQEASSVTIVSSPSVTPQASEQPLHTPPPPPPPSPQQQQQRLPSEEAEKAAPVRPSAVAEADSASAPVPTAAAAVVPSTLFHDADTTLPSVSDIMSNGGSSNEAETHPAPLEDSRRRLESPLKDEIPLRARLRSPTPEGPSLPRKTPTPTAPAVLITSPLEPPRPSPTSVDEPPPRAVREESERSQPGSQPKDRSTTARPPSTPPAPCYHPRSEPAGQGQGAKGTHRPNDARRAASNDSDGDEATLFFHEPPRCAAQEVTPVAAAAAPPPPTRSAHAEDAVHPTEAASRVEVDLLHDDFVMPSRNVGAAAAATAPHVAARLPPPPPPPRTPTTPTEQAKESTAKAEADAPHASAQPAPAETELPSHRFPHGGKADKKASSSSTMSAISNREKKGEKERSKSPRSRRLMDDDDEPSLQFSAPPPLPVHRWPPPPMLPRPSNNTRAEVEVEKAASSLSAGASPNSSSLHGTSAIPTDHGSSTSAHVTPVTPAEQPQGGVPAYRPLHQPRRAQPTEAGPSLSLGGGGVAPPRLQRSAPALPSAPAPLAGPSAPGFAGPQGSRPAVARRASPSSSMDRPPADVTPALTEPQRPSKLSRPDPTITPSSTAAVAAVTTDEPEPAPRSPARAPLAVEEFEEEEVEDVEVRSGTVTPKRAAARVHTTAPVDEARRASEVATELAAEDDLTNSGSKLSLGTFHPAPDHRRPSVAGTATPGSPPESGTFDSTPSPQRHDDPVPHPARDTDAATNPNFLPQPPSSTGVGLPHAVRNDTVGGLNTSASQPADPLAAVAPAPPREPPGRAGDNRSGGTSPRRVGGHGGPGSSEPAPLPTVNVDAPESNSLGLRRASPTPAASSVLSSASLQVRGSSTPAVTDAVSSLPPTPRSRSDQSAAHSRSDSTVNVSATSDAAAAKRREDVARILERIRAKREQEPRSASGSPTTATVASPTSSSRPNSEDPSSIAE